MGGPTPRPAPASPALNEVRFDGALLRRGFWLYVWEIAPPGGAAIYYVGRTGDSSSTNAQSPFNRMSQHLGSGKSNMLRRHLAIQGIEPEACTFRLVALGPLEAESKAEARHEHDERRDDMAAMERALAELMTEAGCLVLNRVHSRKRLDAARFSRVREAFVTAFPQLTQANGAVGPTT
jgi:hypothetical protein